MDTVLIKNVSSSPRIIAWHETQAHQPGPLSPGWDPVRGAYGDHFVVRQVVIPPGESRDLPSDVLARLRETDAVVGAWFQVGDLVEVAA